MVLVREVRLQALDIVELENQRVLEILRHRLLVAGQPVHDAPADAQAADRRDVDGRRRQRLQYPVAVSLPACPHAA